MRMFLLSMNKDVFNALVLCRDIRDKQKISLLNVCLFIGKAEMSDKRYT